MAHSAAGRRFGRRPAQRHQPGLADPAPALLLPRPDPAGPGGPAVTYATWFGGVYQDERNFFPQIAVDKDTWLDVYAEYVLRGSAARRSCGTARRAWSAEPGQALRLQGRRPDPLTGDDLAGRLGVQRCRHLRGQQAGGGYERHDFRCDYLEERRQFGKGTVGWYVVRLADPDDAARSPRRSTSGSPTRPSRP